jgi:hypothetical protein
MPVALDAKADLPSLTFLERFDFVRAELEDRAALAADEVIVMPSIQLAFEACLSLEDQGLGETCALQKFQGTVNRGSPDPRRLSADEVVKIVNREMFVRGEESADDHVPPRTPVEAPKFQVRLQGAVFVGKCSLH